MSQPEARIVTAVMRRIRELGGVCVKTHPAGGTAGTPDVIGAIYDRGLAFEVKRPQTRNNTHPRQRHQLELWRRAGAITGVVCSADEAEHLIRNAQLIPPYAVAALETAMRCNQDSHGDRWRTRPIDHHVRKAIGHAGSAEPHGHALDDDTGLPHLTLAATRLVLAVGVLLDPTHRQDAP